MELTNKQKIQEGEYDFPYHWVKTRDTIDGRLYFGYLKLCADVLTEVPRGLCNPRILDAGCGDARFLKELESAGVVDLHGIDYSVRAISFAKLLLPKASFSVSSLFATDYQDKTFDFIFMIEVLEHLIPDDIEKVLLEFKRILKDDGVLVITVPSLLAGIPLPDSKHYQHFTSVSLGSYLEPHFFKIEFRGQDKTGFHPLKLIYKFFDNRYWDLRYLRKIYNLRIWPRFFNKCDPSRGRRLIAICKK